MLPTTPHRRYNVLTGEWITVSPHRTQRPWQGRTETILPSGTRYDPTCYLCPGNTRANGDRNPPYQTTYAFNNDFPALVAHVPSALSPADKSWAFQLSTLESQLLRGERVSGVCRVLCFSPRHDLTLAQMTPSQIRCVVDLWVQQAAELARRWRWVQIFENKGELMGCSNPHPHGQIWASDFLPSEPSKELTQQREWFEQKDRALLVDYAELECRQAERIVVQTIHWVAVIPWWAVWPFETLILPRRHVLRLHDLNSPERDDLSTLLQKLLAGYDRLFDTSFPYSMGWHSAPNDDGDYRCWQLHAHVYPPLLRSATVKKFMVGYEMLAEPQRDLTPEHAAARLRESV